MVIRNDKEHLTAEEKRLKEDREHTKYWRRWGPYLSERQWVSTRQECSSCGGNVLMEGFRLQYGRTIRLMETLGPIFLMKWLDLGLIDGVKTELLVLVTITSLCVFRLPFGMRKMTF